MGEQRPEDWLKEGVPVRFIHGDGTTMYVGAVLGANPTGNRIIQCYWAGGGNIHRLEIPEHLLRPA